MKILKISVAKILYSMVAIALLITYTTSCRKIYECPKSSGFLEFIGYDSTEVDTVLIYYYTKNTDFSNLVDSSLYTKTSDYFSFSGDTSFVSYYPVSTKITPNTDNSQNEVYDLKVVNKFDNKTVFLKDFTFTINQYKRGLDPGTNHCESPINSYNQDGVIIKGTGDIYINK